MVGRRPAVDSRDVIVVRPGSSAPPDSAVQKHNILRVFPSPTTYYALLRVRVNKECRESDLIIGARRPRGRNDHTHIYDTVVVRQYHDMHVINIIVVRREDDTAIVARIIVCTLRIAGQRV